MIATPSRTTLTGLALATALAIGGCSASARDGATALPPPVDCGAAALADRAGQPVTGTTAADVRVGGAPVQSQGNVRVIGPGTMVTQDFRTDRLNLEVTTANTLIRAFCG